MFVNGGWGGRETNYIDEEGFVKLSLEIFNPSTEPSLNFAGRFSTMELKIKSRPDILCLFASSFAL